MSCINLYNKILIVIISSILIFLSVGCSKETSVSTNDLIKEKQKEKQANMDKFNKANANIKRDIINSNPLIIDKQIDTEEVVKQEIKLWKWELVSQDSLRNVRSQETKGESPILKIKLPKGTWRITATPFVKITTETYSINKRKETSWKEVYGKVEKVTDESEIKKLIKTSDETFWDEGNIKIFNQTISEEAGQFISIGTY